MKKTVVVLAILAAVAVIAYSQRATIATQLMKKGLESRMGADIVAELEDGLHLALCGAGGPLPGPNASGPCVARSEEHTSELQSRQSLVFRLLL